MTISAEDMARLYTKELLSLGEIADRAGMSKTTVWRQLRRHNVPLRKAPDAEPLDAQATVEAYISNGRSISAAAKALGVGYRDVRRALIRSGTYKPERIGGLPHLDSHHKSGDEAFRCAVADLRDRGMSKSAIAHELRTTRETVDYIIYLIDRKLVPEDECDTREAI